MSRWIETDECRDILGSLEQCALSLHQTRQSKPAWKWVVLSLHNALQGAMVCHLSGTAGLGALSERSCKDWLEWHERDRHGELEDFPPRDFVAGAPDLFKRLGNESSRIENGCGRVIAISDMQEKSFKRLHSLRNEFVHFSPKGWSIERKYISEIICDILDVICLILDDDWPFRMVVAGASNSWSSSSAAMSPSAAGMAIGESGWPSAMQGPAARPARRAADARRWREVTGSVRFLS